MEEVFDAMFEVQRKVFQVLREAVKELPNTFI